MTRAERLRLLGLFLSTTLSIIEEDEEQEGECSCSCGCHAYAAEVAEPEENVEG